MNSTMNTVIRLGEALRVFGAFKINIHIVLMFLVWAEEKKAGQVA